MNGVEIKHSGQIVFFLFLFFTFTLSCHSQSDTAFYLSPVKLTPLSFIKEAKECYKKSGMELTMFDDFPADWVKPKDVNDLLYLIHSKTKCSCFVSPLSSYIPFNDYADAGDYA